MSVRGRQTDSSWSSDRQELPRSLHLGNASDKPLVTSRDSTCSSASSNNARFSVKDRLIGSDIGVGVLQKNLLERGLDKPIRLCLNAYYGRYLYTTYGTKLTWNCAVILYFLAFLRNTRDCCWPREHGSGRYGSTLQDRITQQKSRRIGHIHSCEISGHEDNQKGFFENTRIEGRY